MSIYTKLGKARLDLQNVNLEKSGHNKFSDYKYFELGDFLPAINKIFDHNGLCGVVSFTQDLATLTITDVDDLTQIIITSPMGSAALKGCHEVQNVGAVETYQRRYLWVVAMEIVEHDALDATTGKDEPVVKAKPKVDVAIALNDLNEASSYEAFSDVWRGLTKEQRDAVPPSTLASIKAKFGR